MSIQRKVEKKSEYIHFLEFNRISEERLRQEKENFLGAANESFDPWSFDILGQATNWTVCINRRDSWLRSCSPIRAALRARVGGRQVRKTSPKQPLKIRLDSNYQSGIEVNGLSSILH